MSAPHRHRLLVVDDEPDLRTLYELTLLREGYHIETAGCVEDAWQLLSEQAFSVVITDMRLPDGEGLDLIRRLDAAGRPEKCIVITAYGSAENAVSALKAGAYDYLTKPVDLKQFRSVIASALQSRTASPTTSPSGATASAPTIEAGGEQANTPAPLPGMARLAGHSPAMQQVRVLIDKVARNMAPVLLWGESGTGKELVARAIHDCSSRATAPFIAVNCGAIPEQLLEAEFFGFRKGAFTGANEDRVGFFQAAHGGTLFLDEIGDLPMPMQSKLLRAIQERAVRPVGATQEAPVDVRIISASHKDLGQEVQAQRFRQDLFYRLNVIRIALPPLRERLEDLPILCQRILDRIARESAMPEAPRLAQDALRALRAHSFPGNVRELENMLHRAVALSNGAQLGAEDLGLNPDAMPDARQPAHHIEQPSEHGFQAESLPAAAATDSTHAIQATRPGVPLPSDLVNHLDQVEREILVQALEKHRLNRTAAGASLGLSLRQMRYRMARLGVQVTDQGVQLGERFDPDTDGE
jgi:two-component system response regulator PilR (NtrC family)